MMGEGGMATSKHASTQSAQTKQDENFNGGAEKRDFGGVLLICCLIDREREAFKLATCD